METVTQGEHGLRRELRLPDLVLGQVLNVMGSAWVGVAAGLGEAQALIWLATMVLFYLPMAASVICLGREMPVEGGLYEWARRAFGNGAGFLTAWNVWAYAMVSTASILFQIPSEIAYMLGPRAAELPENHGAVFGIAAGVLVVLVLLAVRGLRTARWFHGAGGVAALVVFGSLVLLPLWAVLHRQPLHYVPLTLRMPVANLRSLALMGQVSFALGGLEYMAILAGESRDAARSLVRSVWLASPLICGLMIFGSATVLAYHQAHPGTGIDLIAPIPQTLRLAVGQAGWVNYAVMGIILLLQVRLAAACSVLFTGLTRLPMTAGWDHLVPAWFTRLHPRWKTPVNSIVCSAAVILGIIMLGSLGVHAQEGYQVLNDASNILYMLAYLAMFAIPLLGARELRARLPGWLRVTSLVGFCTMLFALAMASYPVVDVAAPWRFAGKIVTVTALVNLAGWAFYRMRQRTLA